ncbi:ABC1-C atypical protein kinase [Microbotryum lychnidis-dioicae p1A1 Lamole]|uniref:ABC1-C atypical protein kinase n=1 Tax=Microbotryum lychnidis-dioicae (strain p1A1 Lamole / MvSl-1064) TaxID=683840 RepID=U5H0B6_USTV1|nr:ABC1-C atypical protein kinase [Microbotryum lychnidis-dioicae p1A1 Lamole]|eukprot:KDE09138.1 ABC1-C atypical protein kinase [Microbotryum lychnidis-dioicae p1A1 Lamole]
MRAGFLSWIPIGFFFVRRAIVTSCAVLRCPASSTRPRRDFSFIHLPLLSARNRSQLVGHQHGSDVKTMLSRQLSSISRLARPGRSSSGVLQRPLSSLSLPLHASRSNRPRLPVAVVSRASSQSLLSSPTPLPRPTWYGKTFSTIRATGSKNHDHGRGHQWKQTESSSESSSSWRWSLIPILLAGSSPLLLESHHSHDHVSTSKPSLKSIKENIDHPEESEFLVADGDSPSTSKRPLTLLGRIGRFFVLYVFEPISTTGRFIHLAILFLPVILSAPVLMLEVLDSGRDKRRVFKKKEGPRLTTSWWYWFLVHQMEMAGPTFIKLAQWAGSRTDLFPSELCELFGKLHSNGKPHSLRYTKRVIEQAFGRPFSEIFLEFGEKPMGIGAIAQVYKATINPDLLPDDYLDPKHEKDPSMTSVVTRTITPRPDDLRPPKIPSSAVAIKVLHPDVEKMIARDLKIMMFFARVLNVLPGMEWLSFPEEVQVFGQMMMSQIDLRIEANNLQTFENNFRHRPTVSFPRALKKYTSKRVLFEEFEDAVPLEAFLNKTGGAFDHRLANLGLDAFLHMLLIDDFSHADLHPGNIMVKFFKPTTKSMLSNWFPSLFGKPSHDSAGTADDIEIVHNIREFSKKPAPEFHAELARLDAEGYQPELVFIDAGLVTRLDGQNRQNFLDLFSAVARFDGYEAGRLMVERCRAPELVIDEEQFALRMQHLVLSVKSQTFSLANIKIADVLSEVLNNVRRHHVKMEADFVNTVISILLLEGIGRQLDPGMDLFKSALPILRQLGTTMSTEQMRQGAGDLGLGGLGTMLKVWVWIEARQMAELAVKDVDQLIRYDYLMPNV